MPLTREQSNYINTGGTIFLPSVAIDNNLGVRGTSTLNSLIVNSTSSFNDLVSINAPVTIRTSLNAPSTTFTIINDGNGDPLQVYRNQEAGVIARRYNGSYTAQTPVLAGQREAFFVAGGYDGTSNWINNAAVNFLAAEDQTTTAKGSYITFETTTSGTTGRVERMRIDGTGTVKYGTQVAETVTVSATSANTTVAYDVLTNKNVLYYTSNAGADWTFNVRGNATTTLNSMMDIGQSLTVVFMNTNGATAYRATALQIDGSAVTPKWFGGTAPTTGNASSIDVYTYNIIKTASATYTVLASQNKFA